MTDVVRLPTGRAITASYNLVNAASASALAAPKGLNCFDATGKAAFIRLVASLPA